MSGAAMPEIMPKDTEEGCKVFLPTAEQIAEACRLIQETWSPEERAKRVAYPAKGWTVPRGPVGT